MSAGKKNANDGAADGAVAEHGGDGAEVAEDRVQVVEYAAAIDVAKGFGMVCTRVPGSRPDRRRQRVWRVEATCAEVTALMDHLRREGIQRLVLESTSVIRGANRLKLDIAQVMPSRMRPRREGQKRQRGEVVAGSAPRSAVCAADGPQVTRPRQEKERAKRTVICRDGRPSHDPGLPATTGVSGCDTRSHIVSELSGMEGRDDRRVVPGECSAPVPALGVRRRRLRCGVRSTGRNPRSR